MLNITDNSVDEYVIISFIEHIKDINKVIDEIYRALKKKLIATIPFVDPYPDNIDFRRLTKDTIG
jgi:ubiquinone/menaquinone biosynthesis C-methylase UbiE